MHRAKVLRRVRDVTWSEDEKIIEGLQISQGKFKKKKRKFFDCFCSAWFSVAMKTKGQPLNLIIG